MLRVAYLSVVLLVDGFCGVFVGLLSVVCCLLFVGCCFVACGLPAG